MRTFLSLIALTLLTVTTLHAGTKAPDWKLKNLQGQDVKLADFQGKVVILNFWATWCPPCRDEIAGLIAMQKKYGEKGLAIIGISNDEGGVAGVKRFAAEKRINYPIVMGDRKVDMMYGGIEALPTTFIVNRQGIIVSRHLGSTDLASFEKEITALL